MKNVVLALITALMVSSVAIATSLDEADAVEFDRITSDERIAYRSAGLPKEGVAVLVFEHLATGTTGRIVLDLGKLDDHGLRGGSGGDIWNDYQGTTGDFSTYHVMAGDQMIGVLTVNNATGESYYQSVVE